MPPGFKVDHKGRIVLGELHHVLLDELAHLHIGHNIITWLYGVITLCYMAFHYDRPRWHDLTVASLSLNPASLHNCIV